MRDAKEKKCDDTFISDWGLAKCLLCGSFKTLGCVLQPSI